MWRNWCGLEQARPTRVVEPRTTAEVVAEVQRARAAGSTVKMVGTGHSFTGIAAPEHTMLLPTALTGITAVDRGAMTVTARAGTRLEDLNLALETLGLTLHNMGDIAEQTLAGAVSTGTHGTGGVAAGLAAQVVGMELVTGTGEVLRAGGSTGDHADVLELGRVGLGALGVLTSLTFAVEPLFVMEAHEVAVSWDEALATFDERVAAHHHVDGYWFPHTDRVQLKQNSRLDVPLDRAEPLPRWRHRLDDELLQNTVFGALTAGLNRVPVLVPRANRASARLLSERTYSDVPHRVFTARRDVVFKELEYAVPREAGLDALREVRRVVDASGLRVSFPVEVRTAPADDVPLSTAYGRDSFYVAVHTHRDAPHEEYLALVEAVLRSYDGRPHWGKLHSRTAADLAPAYPRFEDVLALRDRLDPDRVLTNAYLRRVLGP